MSEQVIEQTQPEPEVKPEPELAPEVAATVAVTEAVEEQYPIVNGRPDSPYHQALAARHMSHS